MALCHCIILAKICKILYRPIKYNDSHIIYQYKNKLKKVIFLKRRKKCFQILGFFCVWGNLVHSEMDLNDFQCGWLAFLLFSISFYYFNLSSWPFLFNWEHTKSLFEESGGLGWSFFPMHKMNFKCKKKWKVFMVPIKTWIYSSVLRYRTLTSTDAVVHQAVWAKPTWKVPVHSKERSCVHLVLQCSSWWRKNICDIGIHSFPVRPYLRHVWMPTGFEKKEEIDHYNKIMPH